MAGPPAPPLGYSKFSRFRGPGARQSETDSLILIMYTTRCWVGQTLWFLFLKTYTIHTNRQTDSAEVQEGRQKNIQMYSKTIAYLKIDRQTEQTRDFPAPFRPPSPPTHMLY